ncbi:MAG: hypothetical protein LBM93_11115 [Oscillospiraceae bacterium]|jgi:hypothetical protein|nr:hypothetical protein [Oscillospiraceae bacterium]
MQIELKEYNKEEDELYFFENDNGWFVSEEALQSAETTLSVFSEKDNRKKQITALLTMERLKLNLSEGKIVVEDYRNQIKNIIQEFFKKNNYSVLDETEACLELYKAINDFYTNLRLKNLKSLLIATDEVGGNSPTANLK